MHREGKRQASEGWIIIQYVWYSACLSSYAPVTLCDLSAAMHGFFPNEYSHLEKMHCESLISKNFAFQIWVAVLMKIQKYKSSPHPLQTSMFPWNIIKICEQKEKEFV